MNISNSVEQKRLALLGMALVARGGQSVSANELILDAESLNGWIIGVDYAANGQDKTVGVKSTQNKLDLNGILSAIVGFDSLRSFANDYKMQNHQNAGQFKTVALIVQNNKELKCLSVAFYSRNRIEFIDLFSSSSIVDAANTIERMQPHSILYNGSAAFAEILKHKEFERVTFVDVSNRKCFKHENKLRFKREHDFAVWNMVKAVQGVIFSAIHPSIASDIIGILNEVNFDHNAAIEIPNDPKSLSPVSLHVAECLCLLFTEKTIDMTFTD